MIPAAAVGALLTALFVLVACPRAEGGAAGFAFALVALASAGAAAPFLFDGPQRDRLLAGVRRCATLGLATAVAALAVAVARDGSWWIGLACGAFVALYALAAGLIGAAVGGAAGRALAAVAAVALLATMFFWDGPFLLGAADRKASASLAFHLNPAAAASVSLGFDWVHAKALYTDNETAESLVGIPLSGMGPYSAKLAVVAAVAGATAWWRGK